MITIQEKYLHRVDSNVDEWWLSFTIEEFNEIPFLRQQVLALLLGWA